MINFITTAVKTSNPTEESLLSSDGCKHKNDVMNWSLFVTAMQQLQLRN
jgi:hypothetical protein